MTHKTQPTAHAEITTPISADLRRIDDAGTKSAPITLMTEDRACTWAWDQVREDVGTEGWTAGDSCNFYGFFLWGWNYRGQYETQRPAAPPAPAAVAVPAASEVLDALNYVDDFVARCNGDDRGSCASVNLLRAALAADPAQEHATQLAGQGQEKCVCTFAQRVVGDGCRHCNPQEYIDRLHKCLDEYREEADAPDQAQEDAPIVWPRSRNVGRIGDMSMSASLRVDLDADNDTYVNVWDENGGGSVEFCTPGAGGGKSSRTRVALLALMVAMEADNAEDPRRDWWAARAAQGGATP